MCSAKGNVGVCLKQHRVIAADLWWCLLAAGPELGGITHLPSLMGAYGKQEEGASKEEVPMAPEVMIHLDLGSGKGDLGCCFCTLT